MDRRANWCIGVSTLATKWGFGAVSDTYSKVIKTCVGQVFYFQVTSQSPCLYKILEEFAGSSILKFKTKSDFQNQNLILFC
jgi:hypothetical protein